MASDINVISLTGRLTRDMECRYTNSGTAVGTFSLAFSRAVKKGDRYEEKSCFIDGKLWGKRAESLSPYMVKGQMVAISGELDQETWETGGKRRSKHVLANVTVKLVGEKKGAGQPQAETQQQGQLSNPPAADFEDEIPY